MTAPRISVVAVAYHSKEWERLLRSSIAAYTRGPYEIVIIDNSNDNRGHGAGLDLAIRQASGDYILVLDIDAHILSPGWDDALIRRMEETGEQLIGARGGLLKPMRPACMFFRRSLFTDQHPTAGPASFTARDIDGVKFDVGIHFYFRVLSLGIKVGFLEGGPSVYNVEGWGETYYNGKEPIGYHCYYGTRWFNRAGKRVHDVIDGRKYEEYARAKDVILNEATKRLCRQ